MNNPFPIIDVSSWEVRGGEPMGTKPKCWLESAEKTKWLFKEKYRTNSEDDWSEKIASELAVLIGMPHAAVELANRNGKRGVISRDIVAEVDGVESIPGNNLLVDSDANYPQSDYYHVAEHTLDRVFGVLSKMPVTIREEWRVRGIIEDACDLFTGYLMFDAWIANTDRHHENWAVIRLKTGQFVLSPSYDHAASLGHNVPEDKRIKRMSTKDRNGDVPAYAARARSAIYRDATEKKPLTTHEAFRASQVVRPVAAQYWLEKLGSVEEPAATDIVGRIPNDIMGETAKRFALQLLRANRARLLNHSA